jgi:type IV pilus assembly protein PilM
MAARAIGLDIGTFAVRAAEVRVSDGEPVLLRFGQVALPRGAVRAGEVVDPEAVGEALRRLWREAGFRGRRVVVGVANAGVVVRQADFPAMPEEDLRAALRFEAGELIPIPLEEVELDFQLLEEFVGPEGEARVRILLAAGQRAMLDALLSALSAAGLSATMVDVAPLALVRALAPPSLDVLGEGARSEAIVDVGAGVTNVVVHEDGVPRFVRILVGGTGSATEAVASELGIPPEEAESVKRALAEGPPLDEARARAARVVARQVGELAEQIAGSLDFYAGQPDAVPISRILLTGGGSRTPGILEAVGLRASVPVELARLGTTVRVKGNGIREAEVEGAQPFLPVPIGLALAAGPLPAGGRRITLLPGAAMARRRERAETVAIAGTVVVVAGILGAVWAAKGSTLHADQAALASAEAQASALERTVASESSVSAIEAQVSAREHVVREALSGSTAWSEILAGVATVIPSDVWLTSFTGKSGTATTPGSVSVVGRGFDQTSTARFLLRVAELPSLADVYVTSSTRPAANALVTFDATAEVTSAASDAACRLEYYLTGAEACG